MSRPGPQRYKTQISPMRRPGAGLAALLVLAGSWLVAGGHTQQGPGRVPSPTSRASPATSGFVARPHVPGASAPSDSRTKPIEEVRVGDRVRADNPEASGLPGEAEVVAERWRRVDLVLPSGPHSRFEVDITLLRPLEWVQQCEARTGGTVELAMPELGVIGPAKVLGIGPCPKIVIGPGRVVSGTFSHDSDQVLDLRIEGSAEVVGITAGHRVYSKDRQKFVAASGLMPGEALLPTAGSSSVSEITPRTGVHRVYNLEVQGEHAYRVASLGLLVHNDCPVYNAKANRWQNPSSGRFVASPSNVSTPHDTAVQATTPGAIALRQSVAGGQLIYRGGNFPNSLGPEGQYWSPQNPLTPGYADSIGAANLSANPPNFILGGRISPGANFVTRPAPPFGGNAGGALEVVPQSGGVSIDFFHMPW